jgi:TonB family protein
MSANCSTATRRYVYQPTLIENRLLISRLAIQIAFVKNEFRRDPRGFVARSVQDVLSNRNAVLALTVIAGAVMIVLVIDRRVDGSADERVEVDQQPSEVVLVNLTSSPSKFSGSGPTPRSSRGGGSGGERNPAPPQTGKLPPPSLIQAPIPIAPPVHPPALPVAGIDIDPAMWRDVKAPVYGDPTSTSETPSKGPGEDGGIGTNRGQGVGPGRGPGFGPGIDGNTGGGAKQTGCCGRPDQGRTFRGAEVDQRARLLSKPEPHYTEDARKNQISGTVMLRAIFSSSGEVVQIQALNTLPYGLTERAIAAARQIKFVPAIKDGRPVSVYMQLEYNFNLY